MAEAATAASDIPYSGLQVSEWWGPSGRSSSLIEVWHRQGGGMVAQAIAAPDRRSGAGDPVVALTMTGKQLKLLLANYDVQYAGPGSAAGRPAEVIVVRRPGGRLVARFWLDSLTKLPLRREIFNSRADLISNVSLVHLKLGERAVASMPVAVAHPWTRRLDIRAVVVLRKHGWPVPQRLSRAMRLYDASETRGATGPVLDMSYSDGLSVISLFVQRGVLPPVMRGWQRVAIDGHHAYTSDPDDRAISWSSGGYVFTMVADAPATSVDQAMESLAGSHAPGFWTRMDRGIGRLVTLVKLFH
jgi:sigma-E factor negative regulatory protein RseB